QAARQARVDLHAWLRLRIDQGSHAPGLRAGVVVLLVAPGGEVERVVLVRELRGRAIRHAVKARAARGMEETLGEEARRARVSLVRARPEDALVGPEPLVGEAAVVGLRPGGGAAELLEDLPGRAELEALGMTQTLGQGPQDLEVRLDARRGRL